MRAAHQRRRLQDPVAILERLESFLQGARQPAVCEPGDEPIALEEGAYSLSSTPRGCLLEVWGEAGSLTRRIAAVAGESRGKLTLLVKRFGGSESQLHLLDLGRQSALFEARQSVQQFARTLEKLLERSLPEARLETIQTGADLERSLSPLYPRGVLTENGRRWALLASPPAAGAAAADGALAFGLIWLDALRRRLDERRRPIAGLMLCLPRAHTAITAARLACLDPEVARYRLFALSDLGLEEVSTADHGNLSSELPVCLPPSKPEGEAAELFGQLLERDGVSASARPDGLLTLDVRGLTVGEASARAVTFGLERQKPLHRGNLREALEMIEEVAAARRPDATNRNHALYQAYPEQWLESQVRAAPTALDPTFRAAPWYRRTPATLGSDRGVLDMLGVDHSGRLVVLELKTEEELRLPTQALDYWLRVERHRLRGDFTARGYFPGVVLADSPARLLLVAPALKFHPKTGTLLRHFAPSVPVERIGLTADWRFRLQAVFRRCDIAPEE